MILNHTSVKIEISIVDKTTFDTVNTTMDTLIIGDLVPAVSGPSMPSRR